MQSEYEKVMDRMFKMAESMGKKCPNAWLNIEGIWWPNPHYKGEPVCHPEADPATASGANFNPQKGPSLLERMQELQRRKAAGETNITDF